MSNSLLKKSFSFDASCEFCRENCASNYHLWAFFNRLLMGRTADGSVVAFWAERLARQRRGSLSIAEFCRRERISPPSFYAWRKRLEKNERALFIPLELSRAVEPSASGVQIELPGGALVTLPAEASPELVTTAIRAAMHGLSSAEGRSC